MRRGGGRDEPDLCRGAGERAAAADVRRPDNSLPVRGFPDHGIASHTAGLESLNAGACSVIDAEHRSCGVGRIRNPTENRVPETGDVYLLVQILHDWDDQDAQRILRSVRSGIPEHGVLLLVELIVLDHPRPHPA